MNIKTKILTKHNAGSVSEFQYYARNVPMRQLTTLLKRHERTIKDWTNGKTPIPSWAIAVLRLNQLEQQLIRDQMGITAAQRRTYSEPQRLSHRPAANDTTIHQQKNEKAAN